MAAVSVTIITTLTSTPLPNNIPPPSQSLDAHIPLSATTTTIGPSLHHVHQNAIRHNNPLLWKRSTTPSAENNNEEDDEDDDTDGWKYLLRLYACGYRSGAYEEAIQPPPGQICVLDLRDGLYGFCKDPGEDGQDGKLDLKRDCGGWSGGCVDDYECKEGTDGVRCSAKAPAEAPGEGGKGRVEGVETWLVLPSFIPTLYPNVGRIGRRNNLKVKLKIAKERTTLFLEGATYPTA